LTLGSNEQATCRLCGSASRTSSASGSSRSTGPVSPAIPTCAPLWPTPDAGGFNLTESVEGFLSRRRERGAVSSDDQRRSIPLGVAVRMDKCWCRCHTSTSSAAASPAKTSATPAKAQGSTGNARVFGPNTHDSFANYDPATSSWRTSQLSLLEDSGEFSETWPRAGMTRSGTAFRLAPLAPLIGGTGSGLWRTGPNPLDRRPIGDDDLPTRVVRRESWPTPTKSDGEGGPGNSGREGGENLRTAAGGSLNPTWVEWLMGFPLGWTDLGASETRSSRRSRSGSGTASSSTKKGG
jgi:hypothetical protein